MIKKSMYQKIKYFKGRGLTKSEIVKESGLDFKTVSKYYQMTEEQFRRYLEKVQYRTRAFAALEKDVIEVYRENGFQRLPKAAVYDYLEELHGTLPGSERTFRNYIDYLEESGRMEFKEKARVYTPVPELPFGKQMQIDFGQKKTRSGLKLYIFAAVLSASRYKYCAVQERPFNTQDLIGHLLDCFRYFDGRPEELVIDQDRVMVVSENKGDIIYTRDFKSFIDEMGLKMFVCRKADPESKGKVENLVKFVKRNFFKVRDFEDIGEAKERLFAWLIRRANGKISSATKRRPADLIEEERKALRPLKASIFQKDQAKYREERTLNPAGQISVGGTKYSVPDDYRKKKVLIFKTAEKLYLFDRKTGEQIMEYDLPLVPGGTVPQKDYGHRSGRSTELKAKLMSRYRFKAWMEFVERNYETYPRYFRDQYGEFMKRLSDGIDVEVLKQAIEFCLENKTYSVTDLRDTYEYFERLSRQEPESYPTELLALQTAQKRGHLPESAIQVARRDPAVYQSLLSGEKEVIS